MCAMIYLLYERLRGEILKKREQKQRQRGQEKEVQKISICLCFLLGQNRYLTIKMKLFS